MNKQNEYGEEIQRVDNCNSLSFWIEFHSCAGEWDIFGFRQRFDLTIFEEGWIYNVIWVSWRGYNWTVQPKKSTITYTQLNKFSRRSMDILLHKNTPKMMKNITKSNHYVFKGFYPKYIHLFSVPKMTNYIMVKKETLFEYIQSISPKNDKPND